MLHRMNANRSSNDSAMNSISDESLLKISKKISNKKKKKTKTAIKKTAKKSIKKTDDVTRIIVSNISDIPNDFERVGTGFYRNGHHLWEISRADNGYVLTRKRGEDHVIGYDPEPLKKNSFMNIIYDRFGNEIKQGSKVKVPLHGKVATGTIVLLSPDSLDIQLENEVTPYPPGMVEVITENENDECGQESDKNACDEFEPEINEKQKSDYVGPQSSQSGGIGLSAKTAQSLPEPVLKPSPEPVPEVSQDQKYYQPTNNSTIVEKMNQLNTDTIMIESNGTKYLINRNGDNYEVYLVSEEFTQLPQVNSPQTLMQFENNVGEFTFFTGKTASMIKRSFQDYNMEKWRTYWYMVGKKLAQATPKPKLTEEEKKQRAKERRKQRKLERAGLPKDFKIKSKVDVDELAKLKEKIRIYEQGLDALNHELDNVSDKDNDIMVVDTVLRVLDDINNNLTELDEKENEEREKELSLDEPSELEKSDGMSEDLENPGGGLPKGMEIQANNNKITVLMSDL